MIVASSVDTTALVAASMRARETERDDALFRDPYARILAGDRGAREARRARNRLLFSAVAARTAVFDEFVLDAVYQHGARCVLNLGAGLDARPHRLPLPRRLRWIDADRPALIEYKARALHDAPAACMVERVAVDLADAPARSSLLARLDDELPTIALTEGVLVYLATADVAALAGDLAGTAAVRWWALDLTDEPVARWANRVRSRRHGADPPSGFAAPDAEFFRAFGWEPIALESSWAARRRVGREPPLMRAVWALSPPPARRAFRRLGSFVVLARRDAATCGQPGGALGRAVDC